MRFKIRLLTASLALGCAAVGGFARARQSTVPAEALSAAPTVRPSTAPADDHAIVTGAVRWTVHPGSPAAERAWALAKLSTIRRRAAARDRAQRDLAHGARDRRRRRPWFSYPAATHRVRPALRGARFEGILYSFFRGRPYRCSATVIDSPNGSVVWTAGHCIFNREFAPRPFTNFVFVPGARQGTKPGQPLAPYGVWPAVRWGMTRDWFLHGSVHDIKRDLGALVLARNAAGETISQALGGGQRISFRRAVAGRATVIGYPQTGRFVNNDSSIGCGPRPIGQARFPGAGPNPLAIACAMTLGASGGPWLEHVNARGIGTLVSVTSAEADHSPHMFGPVLDRVGRRLFSALAHSMHG